MNEYSCATEIYVAANARQKRSPSRWRTARHEAAHGTTAIACGGEPRLAVFDSPRDGWAGECAVPSLGTTLDIRIYLAALAFDQVFGGSDVSLRTLCRAVDYSSDAAAIRAALAKSGEKANDLADSPTVVRAYSSVTRLLSAHHCGVLAVAVRLFDAGQLDPIEVADAYSAGDRHQPPREGKKRKWNFVPI